MMQLKEMKTHKRIVSWSGGKDSTATIILMHENNVPMKTQYLNNWIKEYQEGDLFYENL